MVRREQFPNLKPKDVWTMFTKHIIHSTYYLREHITLYSKRNQNFALYNNYSYMPMPYAVRSGEFIKQGYMLHYTGLGVWNSTNSHPIGNCCHQQWRDKWHLPCVGQNNQLTLKTMHCMESLKRPEWQSGAIPKPAFEWLQPGQVGRRTWPRQSWQTG